MEETSSQETNQEAKTEQQKAVRTWRTTGDHDKIKVYSNSHTIVAANTRITNICVLGGTVSVEANGLIEGGWVNNGGKLTVESWGEIRNVNFQPGTTLYVRTEGKAYKVGMTGLVMTMLYPGSTITSREPKKK